jgi:hypothetical protein
MDLQTEYNNSDFAKKNIALVDLIERLNYATWYYTIRSKNMALANQFTKLSMQIDNELMKFYLEHKTQLGK